LSIAGLVDNGLIRPLDPAVKLPEHARVIIVAEARYVGPSWLARRARRGDQTFAQHLPLEPFLNANHSTRGTSASRCRSETLDALQQKNAKPPLAVAGQPQRLF